MKKLLYLFCTSLLVLTSCSSDSSDSTTEAVLLIKEITSDSWGGTDKIIYNGNKIVKEVRSLDAKTETKTYLYDGDLIIEEKEVIKNSWEFLEINSVTYKYENGKLISVLSKRSDRWTSVGTSLHDINFYKIDFLYNSDGTISAKNYRFDNEGNSQINYLSKYFFENGNLVKLECFDTDGNFVSSTVNKYDNRKNPFSNIVGFSQLYDVYYRYAGRNNLLESTFASSSYTENVKYKYSYNSYGYPDAMSVLEIDTTNGIVTNTHAFNTQYHY